MALIGRIRDAGRCKRGGDTPRRRNPRKGGQKQESSASERKRQISVRTMVGTFIWPVSVALNRREVQIQIDRKTTKFAGNELRAAIF